MEKRLVTAAYWIGILCVVIAIVTRGLALVGIYVLQSASTGRVWATYRNFLEAALLFFVMAIASAVIAQAKERKA
ncbi:MAG: hypothetical protein WBA18_08535 [Terracidiphilus sp.]